MASEVAESTMKHVVVITINVLGLVPIKGRNLPLLGYFGCEPRVRCGQRAPRRLLERHAVAASLAPGGPAMIGVVPSDGLEPPRCISAKMRPGAVGIRHRVDLRQVSASQRLAAPALHPHPWRLADVETRIRPRVAPRDLAGASIRSSAPLRYRSRTDYRRKSSGRCGCMLT